MKTEIEPGVYLDVDLDKKVECEHSQHGAKHHGSKARYLVVFKCGGCGYKSSPYILCDYGYIKFFESGIVHRKGGGCLWSTYDIPNAIFILKEF